MQKDITIINLIETLRSTFDFESIEIVDHWEADLCAIGIKRDERLVYISTYSHLEKPVIRYDFDLEISTGQRLHEIVVEKEGRDVSEAQLINEIRSFLKI